MSLPCPFAGGIIGIKLALDVPTPTGLIGPKSTTPKL